MAQRVWRCQDDHRAARPPDAPLRHRRNRQRQLALQKPRRRSRSPRSPRLRNPGQLRRGERYRQNPPLKGVTIGRRYGVKFERRLTRSYRERYKLDRDAVRIESNHGLRIVCLFKAHGVQLADARKERQVRETNLPDRLLREFALLAGGLLSNVALATIASIRN